MTYTLDPTVDARLRWEAGKRQYRPDGGEFVGDALLEAYPEPLDCMNYLYHWLDKNILTADPVDVTDAIMAQVYASMAAKRIAAMLKRRADEPRPVGVISDEDIRAIRRGR